MRIIYSDKVKDLIKLIEPYVEWNKFPPKLKDDAPDDIKKAEVLCNELSEEEKKRSMSNEFDYLEED